MSDDIALVLIKRIEALEAEVAELRAPTPTFLHQVGNPAWYANAGSVQGWPVIRPEMLEGMKC